MNQTVTLVLESKEEQEFWDKAFLVALGKTNSNYNDVRHYHYTTPWSVIAAGTEADQTILTRRCRSRAPLANSRASIKYVCGQDFGYSSFCVRDKNHGGKCRAY